MKTEKWRGTPSSSPRRWERLRDLGEKKWGTGKAKMIKKKKDQATKKGEGLGGGGWGVVRGTAGTRASKRRP